MESGRQIRKVVMLANGHPVFDTRIFVKEALSLREAGFEVTLILPAPTADSKDGIAVATIPPAKSGWQKLFVNPWRIFRQALKEPADSVFIIHDSDILITGVALKFLGRKVIYDAHEDTPLQISYQHWIPEVLKPVYSLFYFLLEKLCGWLFDAIVVAEPVIARYFPRRKTYLVRNFPVAASFSSRRHVAYNTRQRRLIYVGTLSKVRGLFEMLDAARQAAVETEFEFFLGGKFVPSGLESEILKSYNINFRPWVAYDELVDLLLDSRIGIIIPNPVARYRTNYPVKLFEFMAAGLPVIASREGESAAFVVEADCGILVDPNNVDEIARAIVWLFNHPEEAEAMGGRGQQLIFSKYNWEIEKDVLVSAVSRV